MTGHEEFLIAVATISVNTLFAVLAWLRSSATYHVVNSRMDEFKDVLLKASEKSIDEFKKELRDAALHPVRQAGQPDHE